jgi:microcystin-dependent protein
MAQPYVGEIRMFGGNFAPAGWLLCDGQQLSIPDNETLFNLIGTTYGGDGESTFALPNLQGRIPIHMGTGTSRTPYQLAEAGGVEQVTLTVSQMPSHHHPFMASGDTGNQVNPAANVPSNSQGAIPYIEDPPNQDMKTPIVPVGGSQPHDNFQPYLCVNFIISLLGIFPPQS